MSLQTGKHDDNTTNKSLVLLPAPPRVRVTPLQEIQAEMAQPEAGSSSEQGDEAAGSPKGAEEVRGSSEQEDEAAGSPKGAEEARSSPEQEDEAAGSPKGAEEGGGTAKAKGRFLNRMRNPRPKGKGIRTKIKESIKHTALGNL
jgi:hypothetical protein